ncbi:MAG: WD40 repeat domain-containing serine/threonine protein kinase [Planctomycetota bacterium]
MQRIGPYEVVRELGRGGMGVVYEVRHPGQPARLALKLISPELAGAEDLARFAREAELLARLRHPHVVAIHTLGRSERGQPYLVTDLVEGQSLKDVVRAGPLPAAQAARIVRDLAGALCALHAQGIVHRDLKPANVILRPDGAPVLLDFGLARDLSAERLTQTGAVLGTPAYMAPEQLDGPREVDERTDVYGLGGVLYELLAGRPPFEGGTVQVLAAVVGHEPRWPSVDRADVPPDLEAILRRCLAKAKEERYPSASALREDLERQLRGDAVSAPGRGARRRVAPAAALALVVVLGVVVAGFALGTRAPPSPATPGRPVASASVAASHRPTRAPLPDFSVAPVAHYLELRARVERDPREREATAALRRLREREEPLLRLGLGKLTQVVGACLLPRAGALCSLPAGLGSLDLGGAKDRAPSAIAGHQGRVSALTAAPDGRVVVFGAGAAARRYRPGEGRVEDLLSFRKMVRASAVSADGALAAFGTIDGQVRVVRLGALSAPIFEKSWSPAIGALAFLRDGNLLVGTFADEATSHAQLSCWDPRSGAQRGPAQPLPTVDSISVGPAPGQVVIGARGLYRLEGGAVTRLEAPDRIDQAQAHALEQVRFHPRQGRLLYAVSRPGARSQQGRLFAFALEDPIQLRWERPCPAGAACLDVSQDGALLLVAGWGETSRDAWLEVWPGD